MKRIIYILILIIVLIALYGIYFEPHSLAVHEYNIKADKIPKSFKELTFVHFSDLLYKSTTNKDTLKKLSTKINDYEPDVIFFTGDLLYKNNKPSEDDIKDLTNSLKGMNANLYKYAVIGENDKEYLDTYKKILEEADFIILDNTSKLLFYKDNKPINIIGTNESSSVGNLLNIEEKPVYQIVLTHQADNFEELKNEGIDLVLSGHSLLGQVRIPYYGGLLKRDGAKKYIDNYYNENNKLMYVSNGIGTIKYGIRLFNKPSFNIYHFTN